MGKNKPELETLTSAALRPSEAPAASDARRTPLKQKYALGTIPDVGAGRPNPDLMTSGDRTTKRAQKAIRYPPLLSGIVLTRSAFWEKNHHHRSKWRFGSKYENNSECETSLKWTSKTPPTGSAGTRRIRSRNPPPHTGDNCPKEGEFPLKWPLHPDKSIQRRRSRDEDKCGN